MLNIYIGNMYKVDREQKQLMALEGDMLLDEQQFDFEIQQQYMQGDSEQKENFRKAIREIKAGNFDNDQEPDFEVDDIQIDEDMDLPIASGNDHELVHDKSDLEPKNQIPVPTQHHPEDLVTPLKENFDEVKEEDLEESPEPQAHELNSKNQNARVEYDGMDTDPIMTPEVDESPQNQYTDRIEQEYQNEVLETNEKYEGEGEYDQEEIEDEAEGEEQNEQIPLLFVDVNLGEGKLSLNLINFCLK
jgi:hypothetical protein